jgi:flagellin
LNKEAAELLKEINRIAEQTQFGGQNLLTGVFSSSFLVGANGGQRIDVGLTQFSSGFGIAGLGVQGLDITTGTTGASLSGSDVSGATAWGFSENVYDFNPGIGPPSVSGTYNFAVSNDGGATYSEVSIYLDQSAAPFVNNPNLANAINNALGQNILIGGAGINIDGSYPDFRIAEDSTNPAALTASPLGIATGTIGTYDGSLIEEASEALDTIDGALSRVNGVRADLGATQNRFQSTIRNLSNISENVSAARSQIKDTDFATTTAELTRQQIIQQASLTVLGQANQRPQSALSLLG